MQGDLIMSTQLFVVLLLTSGLLLSGCAAPPIHPDDPRYAPVIPNTPPPPSPLAGSLYTPTHGVALWSDQRARQVGDILTVLLEESTTSSKSSTSSVTKDSNINMSTPNILGTSPTVRAFPFNSSLNLSAEIGAARDGGGEAAANQQNQLNGQIAVTVTQVLPNGVLVVRGEKWLQLTEGQEFLRVSGMIRPADVQQDNTISSTKIADARITFSGTGQFAQAHKMGWLAKFFNSIYWPY